MKWRPGPVELEQFGAEEELDRRIFHSLGLRGLHEINPLLLIIIDQYTNIYIYYNHVFIDVQYKYFYRS